MQGQRTFLFSIDSVASPMDTVTHCMIVVTLQQSNHIVNAFMYFCYNVNIISWRSYIDWEMVGFCIVDGVLCINVSDTLITKSVAVHVYTISIIHHSSWPYEMG